jgi:hypothetical protein
VADENLSSGSAKGTAGSDSAHSPGRAGRPPSCTSFWCWWRLVTYSQLGLTLFVVGFYTVAFGFVVAVKSDLLKDLPPGS